MTEQNAPVFDCRWEFKLPERSQRVSWLQVSVHHRPTTQGGTQVELLSWFGQFISAYKIFCSVFLLYYSEFNLRFFRFNSTLEKNQSLASRKSNWKCWIIEDWVPAGISYYCFIKSFPAACRPPPHHRACLNGNGIFKIWESWSPASHHHRDAVKVRMVGGKHKGGAILDLRWTESAAIKSTWAVNDSVHSISPARRPLLPSFTK